MSKQINSTRQSVNYTDFKARSRHDTQRRQVRAQTPLRNDWRQRLVETEHSDVGAVVVVVVIAAIVALALWSGWHLSDWSVEK